MTFINHITKKQFLESLKYLPFLVICTYTFYLILKLYFLIKILNTTLILDYLFSFLMI